MGKSNFVKKICCVFLALVLCLPLVFLTSCTSEDEENKPYLVVAYKPFAGNKTTTGLLSTSTYGELVYNETLDLSKNILEGLVDTYGQGSNNDGLFKRTNNPGLNGVNIGTYLGNSSMSKADQEKYAEELNKMCYASYAEELHIDGLGVFSKLLKMKTLTLSKNGSGLTALDICAVLLKLNPGNRALAGIISAFGYDLPNITLVYGNPNLDEVDEVPEEEPEPSDAEFILKTNNAFIFIGGQVTTEKEGGGSLVKSYKPTGTDYNNTISFVTEILNTNFNVIEKGLKQVTFNNEGVANLQFAHWNYNLVEGNVASLTEFATAKDYIENFLEKYNLTFAVELAKIKLVGNAELPNTGFNILSEDIPTNFSFNASQAQNLKTLYENATRKNASEENKRKFIECASVFIDHYGLTQVEAKALYNVIKEKVVGNENFSESEENFLIKNNYETCLKFENKGALKRLQQENNGTPILQFYIAEETSIIEDKLEVPGYVKSFMLVLLEDVEAQIEGFNLEIEDNTSSNFDYLYWVRCCNDESDIPLDEGHYPKTFGQANDLSEGSLELEFGASDGEEADIIECATIKQFDVDIDFDEDDFDAEDFCRLYSFSNNYNQTKLGNVQYNGWYFDQTKNSGCSFIEVIFASPNPFSLIHFNISSAFFIVDI